MRVPSSGGEARTLLSPRILWSAVLGAVFIVRAVLELTYIFDDPSLLGSAGILYAEAARAWLGGGDPWATGRAGALFAGPPTMLLPFAPFALLDGNAVRWVSVAVMLGVALWSIRRLGLPWYWLAFPPILGSVVLGHPEVLVLGLLTLRGPLAGLAPVVKPYAAAALVAERRWRAFAVALAVVLATALVLPWTQFLDQLPSIGRTLSNQSHGDSIFGNAPLMLIGVAALLALGRRRALWLATPVLWPSAQPLYKVVALPGISRLLALFWAVPIPGATLAGVVVEAVVVLAGRRWPLPAWLRLGTEPIGFNALDLSARSASQRPETMGV